MVGMCHPLLTRSLIKAFTVPFVQLFILFLHSLQIFNPVNQPLLRLTQSILCLSVRKPAEGAKASCQSAKSNHNLAMTKMIW